MLTVTFDLRKHSVVATNNSDKLCGCLFTYTLKMQSSFSPETPVVNCRCRNGEDHSPTHPAVLQIHYNFV
jgi:hypothetical protein